jgi:hypothetical protein
VDRTKICAAHIFEGLIFQADREQKTVRGILRLNGHWVQGSAPAAHRAGDLKIRWLAAGSTARARVDPKGVRVIGARIVGPLDLSDIHVPFAIALVQCSIPERMDLESTNIPFFDLAGSRIGEIFGPT